MPGYRPRHRLRSLLPALVALLLLGASVSAMETGHVPGPPAPGADAVVLGSVVASESRWSPDNREIETTSRIVVEDVLKGSVSEAAVEVTVRGGTVGDVTQVVLGEPILENGTRGCFHLRWDPQGACSLVQGGEAVLPASAVSTGTAPPDVEASVPVISPGPLRRALDGGPAITSVSPQIASAGTNTTVTIAGTGFGTKASRMSTADVGFVSGGGAFWATGRTNYAWNADEIVSWSDTEIKVRVPAGYDADGIRDPASSGSGGIRVVTDAGEASAPVPFAVSFGVTGKRWAAPRAVFLVNDNCPGVTGGAGAVRRAAATWNTALPASFQLDCSGTSTSATEGRDGVNLIAWGPSGRITYWYSGDTIVEADMILSTAYAWTAGEVRGSVYNIESIALRDLGFCIGIAWVSGQDPQGPSDADKATCHYRSDRLGNANLVTLHPADLGAASYLYSRGDPNPPLLAAAFTADTLTGSAPLAVLFTDASIGGATGWIWDFGDGASSMERSPAHTFAMPGTYTVILTASAPGRPQDTVRAIDRVMVNVSGRPAWTVPGGTGLPTDTDGDGTYEDVNGNGRKDFADVVLYFGQMAWIAANEPMSVCDPNASGRTDFADVVWLFNHL